MVTNPDLEVFQMNKLASLVVMGAALALSAGCGSSGSGGTTGATTTPCGATTCNSGEACVQQGCGGYIPDGGTCKPPPPQCKPLPSQCTATPDCTCLSTLASCGNVDYGKLTCSNLCS